MSKRRDSSVHLTEAAMRAQCRRLPAARDPNFQSVQQKLNACKDSSITWSSLWPLYSSSRRMCVSRWRIMRALNRSTYSRWLLSRCTLTRGAFTYGNGAWYDIQGRRLLFKWGRAKRRFRTRGDCFESHAENFVMCQENPKRRQWKSLESQIEESESLLILKISGMTLFSFEWDRIRRIRVPAQSLWGLQKLRAISWRRRRPDDGKKN